MAKKIKQSTEKTLQNQRIAIWLIVGFVAFITLWFVYSVKTLQNTSMTTSTEARNAQMNTGACTKLLNKKYGKTPKTWISQFAGKRYTESAYCCKYYSQYVWGKSKCIENLYP